MQTENKDTLLAKFWNAFYARLVAPSHLPKPIDIQDEQLKINFLRIVLGLLALWRTGMMALSSYYYYPADGFLSCPPEFWLTLMMFVAAGCFTVGLLTPVATIWLLLFYNQMDVILSTQTLGTNLFTLCLFFFLFASAGTRLSIDALNLGNQLAPLHALTRLCYRLVKFPAQEQISAYYWLLLIAYGVMSLAAVSLHLDDGFWQKGESVALMLNNSFLCSLWQLCRFMSAHFPWLVSIFSCLSCVGQALFQVLLIPLIYFRWGVWFVGLWGAAFCIISTILLQISWIPTTETVLWALVFLPASLVAKVLRAGNTGALEATRLLGRQSNSLSGLASVATLAAFALLTVVTLGHHYPSVGLFRKAAKHLGPRLYYLGLDVPDVFNRLDLSTEKYWYVMERKEPSGKLTHVPVALANGSREYYHWFDTVYFSNLLQWRRMMGLHSGNPLELLVPGHGCYELLRRVAFFDRKFSGQSRDTEYLVTIYAEDPVGWTKSPRVLTKLSLKSASKVAASRAAVH